MGLTYVQKQLGNTVSVEELRDTSKNIKKASDLSNYDDTLTYYADGLIDITGVPIEVGNKGFTCYSDNYNAKGFVTEDTSGSVFLNAPGDYAGDINLSKMVCASNPTCGIFNTDNQDNFSEVVLDTVNFGFFGPTKTKMGTLSNYRQILWNNVGMFNLADGLVLEGNWTGFKITNFIGLALGDITLFQAGAGFNTDDFRFISNKLKSVGDNFVLLDFDDTNINESEGLQIKLNELKPIDIIPNISRGNLDSSFDGNSGIQDTRIGGKQRLSATAVTTITTAGTMVRINGTRNFTDLQHFSSTDGGNGSALTYNGAIPKEFTVRLEATIDGGANDEIGTIIRHWDDSAGVYIDIDSRTRDISNVIGSLDLAYYAFEESVVLDTNDRLEDWVVNNDDTTNVTALLDTTLSVKKR